MLNSYEIDFLDCLSRIEVDDLDFSGCFHTWNNRQAGSSFVSKKLDHVLSNLDWV